MAWLEDLASDRLAADEASRHRAGGARLQFSEREGLPLETLDLLQQRGGPGINGLVSELDPDAATRSLSQNLCIFALTCLAPDSQLGLPGMAWQKILCYLATYLLSCQLSSLSQGCILERLKAMACEASYPLHPGFPAVLLISESLGWLVRQRRKWANPDAKDSKRITERVWQLIRGGRIAEACDMCRQCGQSWRAASLGGGYQGPTPLGNVAIQVWISLGMKTLHPHDALP